MTAKQGPRLIVRRSNFDHPKCKLSGFIEGRPFNSALQVILPGAAEDFQQGPLAQSISTLISGRAYHLLRCNLAVLADEDFVERHVRPEAAHFCALSVNTPIDRSDAAAVLPDGRLVLAVTEETHQKLGLVGSKKPGRPALAMVCMHMPAGLHQALCPDLCCVSLQVGIKLRSICLQRSIAPGPTTMSGFATHSSWVCNGFAALHVGKPAPPGLMHGAGQGAPPRSHSSLGHAVPQAPG